MEFKLIPVEKKPKKYRRGSSKYDLIIDRFLRGNQERIIVQFSGKKASYLRSQLKKRIDYRKLHDKVRTYVSKELAYLEKIF
jgi:hypothetical protein